MEFLEMDVIEMDLPADSFDVVIDKGTLDSILCSEGSSQNAIKCIRQIYRVLKSKGTYFCVSYGVPDFR